MVSTGAISGDTDGASTLRRRGRRLRCLQLHAACHAHLSIESWIKTTTTQGGKIVGYGDSATGDSSSYDRHIYMDNAGHIIFGVYNNGAYTITSPKRTTTGPGTTIVATLSSTTGMALYVDGKKVGSTGGTTVGQPYTGYWRIGGDNLNGWPNQPASNYFSGAIDDVAVYPTRAVASRRSGALRGTGRSTAVAPVPTDAYGKAVYASDPELYWRLDEASGARPRSTRAPKATTAPTAPARHQERPGARVRDVDTARDVQR